MGTFNSKCPHCGILVEVQSEWINMEVECPECKERFVIQPPASPQFKLPRLDMPGRFKNTHASPGNTPPEEEAIPQEDETGDEISAGTKIALKHLFGGLMELRKTQYPWGRIYIALARIFAVLVLLAGLCIILNGFHDAFSKRRDLLEELQAESEKIIPRQEAFKEHFEQLAEIVLTGNQSEAKFQFPSDISTTENEFNESLMTEEDVQESLAATEDYAGKLKNMSDVMNQYFQMPARRIETELRKGDTLSITTTTGQNRDSSLDLKLSQNVDFFSMSDSDLREVIQAAFRELDELAASSSIDVKEEVMVLRRGLTFINQALCSKSTDLSVRGRREQEQVSNIQVGRQKLWREVELLRSILEKLNALCRYDYQHNDRYLWQLSGELEQLKNVLLNHETEVKKTRREISRIFGFAGKAGVRQLIVSLILAFLIMVIADFLQAHLDSSDHLRKLCGRGMMLLTLLLLVGCGASPEDWLKEQKEALKTAAIDSMFYQAAVQNNPSATFYGRPGVELIVINGGIFAHTRFPERTMGPPHLFAPIGFGRTYTIIRLKFSVSPESITFNPVKKSNKAPYTHRTMMVLTAKQELVSRPDVFGLGIAALVPEGFDEWSDAKKEEWVKKYYGLLPSNDCDHALVIQKTPYTGSTETITRNFEILFNSKTKCWELGKQEKIESVAPIPEYSETQGEQLRLARGFKSITWTVKKNDPLVLYLQDADCEIIKKLNDGLLLVDGKWVDGETYWQTRRLGELMEKIRNDKELTWTKLEEFAVAVEENSLAKNRKEAVALVESYFESEIETNLENKEKLQYLVKKLQLRCFTIVNEEKRERLLEKCRSRLEEMAAAERAGRAGKKAQLQARKEQQEKRRTGLQALQNFIRTKDLNGIQEQAQALQLSDNPDFHRYYDLFRSLISLDSGNREAIRELAQNQWQIAEYDLRRICDHCQGKGKEPCNNCNSTGVCQICKGTGKKTEYRNIMDKKVIKQVPYTANCHKECIHCNGQSKPCKVCKGQTGFLNGAAVKDAIEKVSSEFCAWLDTLIEETTKHIEELDRQIKELDRQNESTGA